MSATGDIIMGSAPNKLPANGGKGFFKSVQDGLKSDLVMGNLEQPLTGDTGTSKCGSPPRANCFAFRSPTSYAAHLKDAGFELLNTANNHSKDFGGQGYQNTVKALEGAGLAAHRRARTRSPSWRSRGSRSRCWASRRTRARTSLNDLDQARSVVEKAAGQADLVVVQVHMGAEGSEKTRVKPGNELFFGENRGNPIKFSKAVIDAGADVVIGHGPHVLRGMQFYKGKLIAYSLGNFAGGGKTLSSDGVLKYGAHPARVADQGRLLGRRQAALDLHERGGRTDPGQLERARPQDGRRAVRGRLR